MRKNFRRIISWYEKNTSGVFYPIPNIPSSLEDFIEDGREEAFDNLCSHYHTVYTVTPALVFFFLVCGVAFLIQNGYVLFALVLTPLISMAIFLFLVVTDWGTIMADKHLCHYVKDELSILDDCQNPENRRKIVQLLREVSASRTARKKNENLLPKEVQDELRAFEEFTLDKARSLTDRNRDKVLMSIPALKRTEQDEKLSSLMG